MKITISQTFLTHFNNQQEITTAEIIAWYATYKNSKNFYTRHTTVHQMIINPLIATGELIRKEKGLYIINKINKKDTFKVNTFNDPLEDTFVETNETDDFEAYLESKIKEGKL